MSAAVVADAPILLNLKLVWSVCETCLFALAMVDVEDEEAVEEADEPPLLILFGTLLPVLPGEDEGLIPKRLLPFMVLVGNVLVGVGDCEEKPEEAEPVK